MNLQLKNDYDTIESNDLTGTTIWNGSHLDRAVFDFACGIRGRFHRDDSR